MKRKSKRSNLTSDLFAILAQIKILQNNLKSSQKKDPNQFLVQLSVRNNTRQLSLRLFPGKPLHQLQNKLKVGMGQYLIIDLPSSDQ